MASDSDPAFPSNASVYGLAGGRKQARRMAGRRRRRNTATSIVAGVIVCGTLLAAGLIGWGIYREQADDEPVTTPGGGDDVEQIIDQLERQPRWNGPGAPAFGVGSDDATQP